MSKRKSLSQSMQVTSSDIQFEDDDDQSSITGDSAKGGSRVSSRAKKVKAIFDPSESSFQPVHKRKKEALEKEREKEAEKLKTPTKVIKHTTGSSSKQTPETTKTSSDAAIDPSKLKMSAEMKAKLVVGRLIAKSPVKKEPPTVVVAVAAAKEPSKRIQARKQTLVQNDDNGNRMKRKHSASTSFSTEDYDEASTIEFKQQRAIPDVRKWSYQRVYEYFSNTLGYKSQDAMVFKDEEIDGEALMIMKRSDIVNTKFQNLKLGIALKMWTHIIQFQTGSSDPTQAWK